SWAAFPCTAWRRLGTRPDRRFSCTSICAHAFSDRFRSRTNRLYAAIPRRTSTRTIATTTIQSQLTARTLLRYPDGILAARVRPAVEPAVAGDNRETFLGEQRRPLVRREPGELHRRRRVRVSDGQRERSRLFVPVGALPDAVLALQPAAVRLLDVVTRGREDVEHETAARCEQPAHGTERAPAVGVRPQMEKGTKGAGHEGHALGDRRIAEI